MAEVAKILGWNAEVFDGKFEPATYQEGIRQAIAQKVDAIIVQAVDTDATPRITKLASEAKIPLVYVNLKPADFDKLPAGVSVVASDEIVGGTLQAQQVC